jgi:hypothetical protein
MSVFSRARGGGRTHGVLHDAGVRAAVEHGSGGDPSQHRSDGRAYARIRW